MSHPKDTGKEGLTGLPKFRTQSRPQWESNPAGNVRSPFKANALTHSATCPHSNEYRTFRKRLSNNKRLAYIYPQSTANPSRAHALEKHQQQCAVLSRSVSKANLVLRVESLRFQQRPSKSVNHYIDYLSNSTRKIWSRFRLRIGTFGNLACASVDRIIDVINKNGGGCEN